MVDDKPKHHATTPEGNRRDGATSSVDQQTVDPAGTGSNEQMASETSGPPGGDPHDGTSATGQEPGGRDVPPIIDLPPSEFSEASDSTAPSAEQPVRPRSAVLLPALSGAVAAAITVAVAWTVALPMLDKPKALAPAVDNRAIDALTARLASVESKTATPVPPSTDPVIAQRLDAVEKSVASLRDAAAARTVPEQPAAAADPALTERLDGLEKSLATLRREFAAAAEQSQQLAGAVNALKSAPATAPTFSAELATLNERLSQIERTKPAAPVDDAPLRRAIAATLLDLSVRQGEPYATALQVVRPLADDIANLKPLEAFAASGVPSAPALSRELIELLPQLSASTSSVNVGLLDRLQAGAEGLIRIQRPDGVPGESRAAIVSRVAAAAQRNDIAAAKRELAALPPTDRTPALRWIEKADAREAALAASRQFAAAALAALPKSSQ